MLINKHNLSVSQFGGDEGMAYNFGNVKLEKGKTVGTNGKMIATCTVPNVEEKDYPDIDVKGNDIDDKGVLVPVSVIEKVKRNILKKTSMPILLNVQVKATDEEVLLSTTDLETVDTVKVKRDKDVRYPDVDSYTKEPEEFKEWDCIGMHPKDLEVIGKAFRNFEGGPVARFYVNPDKQGPNVLTACNASTGQRLTVHLMPRKTD